MPPAPPPYRSGSGGSGLRLFLCCVLVCSALLLSRFVGCGASLQLPSTASPAGSAEILALSQRLREVVSSVLALDDERAARFEAVEKRLVAALRHSEDLTEAVAALAGRGNSGAGKAAAAGVQKQAPAAAVAPVRTAWEAIRGEVPGGGVPQGRPCLIGSFDGDMTVLHAALADTAGPGFAFVRYADGELGVAQGRAIGNDEWSFVPGASGNGIVQSDLLASLRGHHGARYWYAFASPLDDAEGLAWFLQRTEQECAYISYANMWVNAHYPATQVLLRELTSITYRGRTLIVANAESVDKVREAGGIGSWAVDAIPLADNLVSAWEAQRVTVKAAAEALARAHSSHLVMVSGGPVGKIIIAWMWAANPTNRYIDFGSSLDPFLRGKNTRPYHNSSTASAKQVDPSWYVDEGGRARSMPA